MSSDNDQEFIDAVSFAQSGINRSKVINAIGIDMKMPSKIAKELDLRQSQISATLAELKSANLVVCLNEEKKRGRLYQLTDLGLRFYEYIDENKNVD